MMSKVTFGAYYNTNSIIHKMDARVKMIAALLFMIVIFLIPMEYSYIFIGLAVLLFVITILAKVPIIKFFNSLKQVSFLLMFSFVFQLIFNKQGGVVAELPLNFSVGTIAVIVLGYVVYSLIIYRKKFMLKWFANILLIAMAIYILKYPLIDKAIIDYRLPLYKGGLYTGLFILIRVFLLIVSSSLLTLTTKPTELNFAIEFLLKPLEFLKIKTSIFAMMMSIALRFIPTLFLETEKILKAQASRGADFAESSIKNKIRQVVSLLVPMFVISFKRAEDLSAAMEVRGYIPGAKRTSINEYKLKAFDIISLVAVTLLTSLIIAFRIFLKVRGA